MTNEEEMMAAIKYVEENNGESCLGRSEHIDQDFVELAKKLARTLKAKLVKVEDNFGQSQ